MSETPVVVIGEGWAALGAVGFLAQAGREIRWISGTGSRIFASTASLEAGPGVAAWAELARRFGIETGGVDLGSFLREYRNKSFREPAWIQAPTLETRRDVRDELLWAPERFFAPSLEARFELPWGEIEEQIRARIAELPNVQKTEGTPIQGFRMEGEGKSARLAAVVLGSGEEIACSRAIYADRWSNLPGLDGLPKPIPFIRGREPMNLLQAMLTHESPMPAGLKESFFAALHKEAGEEIQRSVYGFFSPDGKRSIWSVVLGANEGEDNHEIAKKLRRMKQALERVFTGSEWLPEGKTEFMANVSSEQVRFEEFVVFGAGKAPQAVIEFPRSSGLEFLTDGYGPSSSLAQVASLLGAELSISTAQAGEWIQNEIETQGVDQDKAK
jgi:hypothetical protein